MSTKSTIEEIENQQIVDDLPKEEAAPQVNADKLAALKAKMAEKADKPLEKKKSIRMGVVGSGQAGSRLAETFNKLGYPAIAINTAPQDLEGIDLPPQNKLLLDYGLGGAAKDLSIGHAAAEAYEDVIKDLVTKKLGDEQMLLFCTSLGGGSGAGSSEVIVDILASLQMPIGVITILPQASDDFQVKYNALTTLGKFTKMVQAKKIDNLIVVDNAKIQTIYSDVSPFNFFKVSNQAIAETIDVFNTLSATDSSVKPLDSTEFGKLFTDGKGLTTYGSMKVYNYEDETAIAEAVVENVNGNLLASGFDIKQARYVGFILAAPKSVWDKIPSSSLHYANHMINDVCSNPIGVFQGIYETKSVEDCITVYSMFSGLGLPSDRIEQLKAETKEKQSQVEKKEHERSLSLKLDVAEETVNAADEIRKKIEQKKSSFGKLHGNAVVDRRKR